MSIRRRAEGNGAPLKVIFDNNDDDDDDDNNDDDNNDDDDDDDDFVGTTTNFYYLHLKIALLTVAVTSNLTIQPRT